MDWFLHDNGLRHERVNTLHAKLLQRGTLKTTTEGFRNYISTPSKTKEFENKYMTFLCLPSQGKFASLLN